MYFIRIHDFEKYRTLCFRDIHHKFVKKKQNLLNTRQDSTTFHRVVYRAKNRQFFIALFIAPGIDNFSSHCSSGQHTTIFHRVVRSSRQESAICFIVWLVLYRFGCSMILPNWNKIKLYMGFCIAFLQFGEAAASQGTKSRRQISSSLFFFMVK